METVSGGNTDISRGGLLELFNGLVVKIKQIITKGSDVEEYKSIIKNSSIDWSLVKNEFTSKKVNVLARNGVQYYAIFNISSIRYCIAEFVANEDNKIVYEFNEEGMLDSYCEKSHDLLLSKKPSPTHFKELLDVVLKELKS